MDENISDVEFGIEPELVFEEKAIGGKLGPQIGRGLLSPGPGKVFVDITGAIDGDGDGIVFEGTPFKRPIIPRAAISIAEANRRGDQANQQALVNEQSRRPRIPKTSPTAGSPSRTGGSGGRKKGKQRKLTPEELRIQQEQKLRAQRIPKKKKPGPDAQEWDSGSKSTTRSQAAIDNPNLAKIVDDYLDIYPPVGSKSSTRRGGGKQYPKKTKEEKLDQLTKFLADALIAALEKSENGKWERPWRDFGSNRNGKTGKPYKGSNQAILALVSQMMGYEDSIWLTYKQAQELGGQVRKGEKGTMLSYWKRSAFEKIGPDGESEEVQRWMTSFFTVFNIDQIDGIDKSRFPKPEVLSEEKRIEAIQGIVEELGVLWSEVGDQAFFRPSEDRIQMPPFGSFNSAEAFYATLMHEVLHWTGGSSRLDRPQMNRFGSPDYAFEELIAEIGSSMLMAVLGLEDRPDDQHVAYIGGWLKALKDDPSQVSQAAAAAQKAIDWLIDNSPTLKKLFNDYYPPIGDGSNDEGDGDIGIPDMPEAPSVADDVEAVSETLTPQDSSNSLDYDNFGPSGSKSSTAPKYPRKPPAPAFSGRAAELIDGVRTWDEFWERMKDEDVVFIDYETTGLVFDEFGESSSNGLPTQIGAVRMRNGEVIDRFNIYINPGVPHSEWEEWSRTKLKDQNGDLITQEFLDGQVSIAEAHQMFVDWAGQGVILGMQNAVFDDEVLTDALRSSGIDWRPDGILDTKEISDATLPRWTPDSPEGPYRIDKDTGEKRASNSLADITKYLGVALGEKHHTADFDAEATGEVLTRIVEGAIEKGWSTDALDPEKRRLKEIAKQEKFEQDIAKFNEAKKAYLAAKAEEDGSNIGLDISGSASRTSSRTWSSSDSVRSERSPKRKDVVHVGVDRVSVDDVLPDNWDNPGVEVGDPRWQIRYIAKNADGTVSMVLGDLTGEEPDANVVVDRGAKLPNVSRGLRQNLGYPRRARVTDARGGFIDGGKLKKWNDRDVVERANRARQSTEFALFDDGIPGDVSIFDGFDFNRGEMRSRDTNKLNPATNKYTVNGVENAMTPIAKRFGDDGRYTVDDAANDIRSLRNDIYFNGFLENLDKNIINDLVEGTHTGESYKRINRIASARGLIGRSDPRPVAYPLAISGSKSSTRNDLRPNLPVGTLVRRQDGEGVDGGFWRGDYEEPLFRDSVETESYKPEIIRNLIIASKLKALGIDELLQAFAASAPKDTISRDKVRRRFEEILARYTAVAIDNGNILFISRGGTKQFILEKRLDGTYAELTSPSALDKLKSSMQVGVPGARLEAGIVRDGLPNMPHSRYKANLERAQAAFPGNVIGFRFDNAKGHHAVWLVDDFGHLVSIRAAGMSSSPGSDDSKFIEHFIFNNPEVRERFEISRGKLTADREYMSSMAQFISTPPSGTRTDDRYWFKSGTPLDQNLGKKLIWSIDIPLRSDRQIAYSETETSAIVQMDIYQISPDVFRVRGAAVMPNGEISEIEVDFPTRSSAIAYAMSEVSPYPHHVWAMNMPVIERRIPSGVDASHVVDQSLRELLIGDRIFSNSIGLSGSRSVTGSKIYFESNGTAENILLNGSDDMFEDFITRLSEINDTSRAMMRRLDEELAKPDPDDSIVEEIERAMKVHDLITSGVTDALFAAASKNRQWRVRRAALEVAKQILRDETKQGAVNFSDEEVVRIARSLDEDGANLFGLITSQATTDRIDRALSVLRGLNWPETFDLGIDENDELSDNDIQRLIDNPTPEIIAAARQILQAESATTMARRSKTRRNVLEEIDSRDDVLGYRPMLLGDNTGGSKSTTGNPTIINGSGLGDSRIIFPRRNREEQSSAVEYVYYDGARKELTVRFARGTGEYKYGGVEPGFASKLERSYAIGRDLNEFIRSGQWAYEVKPNGEISGEMPSMSDLMSQDIVRINAKYKQLDDSMIDDLLMVAKAFDKGMQGFVEFNEEFSPDGLDFTTRRLYAIASKLSQISGEHAMAGRILEMANSIDDFRRSGNAGRASLRNRMPLKDKTVLNLNNDELGEIRQELKDILRAHGDDGDIAPLMKFHDAIVDAQKSDKPLTLTKKDHEEFAIAYDKLYALAKNGDADSRFKRTVGESILNLSAFTGVFNSQRVNESGGFRGRPLNDGAPSWINTAELIYWARQRTGFKKAQKLVSEHDNNDGILTTSQWVELAGYHDSSLKKRTRNVASDRTPGSKSSTNVPAIPGDEPSDEELSAIEKPSGQPKKKSKMPEGRSIQDIFGDDLDGMSPEQQIDALFEVGIATPSNKDGINQAEFEARVRELDAQLTAMELLEEETARLAAADAAIRNGEEFDEDSWLSSFRKDREAKRKEVVRQYIGMLLGDDPKAQERAERWLGVTKEEYINRQNERNRLIDLEKQVRDQQAKKATKEKISYPLPTLINKLRRIAQTQMGVLTDPEDEQHQTPWRRIEEILGELSGGQGSHLAPDSVLEDVADYLNDYINSIFSSYDPDRSSYEMTNAAKRSISQARKWYDVVMNSLDAASNEDDDEIIDDEDGPDGPNGPGAPEAPSSGSKSTTASPMFYEIRPEYEEGSDSYRDRLVRDPNNWIAIEEPWGETTYKYIGNWPSDPVLHDYVPGFPQTPPSSIIGKIRKAERNGPETILYGERISVLDTWQGIPDDVKRTVVDGIRVMPRKDEPRLEVGFIMPGSRGEKFIDVPAHGGRNKNVRYTRKRPNWMNTSRERPDLSTLTDSELKRILAALRTDPDNIDLIMGIMSDDQRIPRRILNFGDGRDTGSRVDIGESKYKIDDIINELESRGFFVYVNEDPTSNAPMWYVVESTNATDEQIGRRVSSRWNSSVDQTTKPEDRADPDGERDVKPVDVVNDIIDSGDALPDESNITDLIDNSDIDEMTLDDVNAELIGIRDELEDLRRRANEGSISRDEYNARRRELNKRKNLLLARKHGGKDAVRRKKQRPKSGTPAGKKPSGSTGSTTINVTGDNSGTMINIGNIIVGGRGDTKSRRRAEVEINVDGVDDLRDIAEARALLRGADQVLSGSRSSTSDSSRRMRFYELEFGLTGEDIEEIVHGVGSEESIKAKFGLNDDDILFIRSNWTSSIPLEDLARARGASEFEVELAKDYDAMLEAAENAIRQLRDSHNARIREFTKDLQRQADDALRSEKREIIRDFLREIGADDTKSLSSDQKAELRSRIKEAQDIIKEQQADILRTVISSEGLKLSSSIAGARVGIRRAVGMSILRDYGNALPSRDELLESEIAAVPEEIAAIVKKFGLLGGETMGDPVDDEPYNIFTWLASTNLDNDFIVESVKQIEQDVVDMFRNGSTIGEMAQKYGMTGDVDREHLSGITEIIGKLVFAPDILGVGSIAKIGDMGIEYPDEAIDLSKIKILPFDDYISARQAGDDPIIRTSLKIKYLKELAQAFAKISEYGAGDEAQMERLRKEHIDALRNTMRSLTADLDINARAAFDEIKLLRPDEADVIDEISRRTPISRDKAISEMFYGHAEVVDAWPEMLGDQTLIDFIGEVTGLERAELISALNSAHVPHSIIGGGEDDPEVQRELQKLLETRIAGGGKVFSLIKGGFTLNEISQILGVPESSIINFLKSKPGYAMNVKMIEATGLSTYSPLNTIVGQLVDSGYSVQDIAELFDEDPSIIQAMIDSPIGKNRRPDSQDDE